LAVEKLLEHVERASRDCTVRETGRRGWGVFASRLFVSDEVVIHGSPLRIVEANDSHAVQVGRGRFGYEEGIGSFVNHSCDPNCLVQPSGDARIDLVARGTIQAGEEVTLDYATRNYVIEFFPPLCLCGSQRCRGRVTGWKDLSDAWRENYGDAVAPYLLGTEAGAQV